MRRVLVFAMVLVSGCQTVASLPPEDPTPSVVLEVGRTTSQQEATAAAEYEKAVAAEEAGDLDGAAESLSTIVASYPATRVSGSAIWLLAAIERRLGDLSDARASAQRYQRALPRVDERRTDVTLFEAEIMGELQETTAMVDALLRLPAEQSPEQTERGLVLVRSAVGEFEREQLGAYLQATALGQPLAAPLMVAYGRALLLGGDTDGAAEYARAALAGGATGPDRTQAELLLSQLGLGTSPTVELPAVQLGALLSETGSPSLQSYSALIQEGVRAAVESAGAPQGVSLRVIDDQGELGAAERGVRSLESSSVVGIVGPVVDEALIGAADARDGVVTLISPSALSTGGREGVYSLGSPDPGAGRALANYAAASGLEYVVVIHSQEEGPTFDAQAFEAAFRELNGSVMRVLTYAPGATYFEEQLRQAEALDPQALVIPASARDIEAIAPQISFFGLDTLGIKILGSADWGSDQVLGEISSRHTNGVVIASPRPAGPPSEAYQEFVEAYEATFQRSVRDMTPAFGYDAASLLLFAIRVGARNVRDVRRALESVRGFEGATGVLSVENGQLVREHFLLCVQNGELLEVEPGRASIHHRPMRAGNADEPEFVPAGPLEVYCPGAEPPELSGGR